MATYNSILKPHSWITADDIGAWLHDDKPERYEVPADPEVFPRSDVPIRRKRYEMLINSACSKIEAILRTNVLAKQFQEDLDCNDSNVIVPSAWPILSIDELKIDRSRVFSAESIISDLEYMLRGTPDKRSEVSTPDLRIIGNDIFMNGSIISGASIGSAGPVRIKYTAGWGRDSSDVPDDIVLATTQLVEWYEFRRSNKDIGVASKGVRGENYSRSSEMVNGIPLEIYQSLEPYINESFGTFESPQTNVFGI